MPCFSPLVGYRSQYPNENGKYPITFTPKFGYLDLIQQVPCGQCVGCRLERSRQWAVRCVHEASLFQHNSFITLTYDDEHLPKDRSLVLKHYQDFMKRLRKKFSGLEPIADGSYPIRFYHCGEYGDRTRRPHYHAILFNFDFLDKVRWKEERNGSFLYVSPSLQKLWPFGYSVIGSVTFDSAAYVARYVMKKVNGDLKEDHYRVIDPDSGEVVDLSPEYSTMSRRPGIGKLWYDKFKGDVYPHDYVVINGKKVKPPKFYDSQFEYENPDDYLILKRNRKISAKEHVDNNTHERLMVREKVAKAKLQLKQRIVE